MGSEQSSEQDQQCKPPVVLLIPFLELANQARTSDGLGLEVEMIGEILGFRTRSAATE